MSDATVRDVGEFGLIESLRSALPAKVIADHRLRVGIGDDAAVWRPAAREALVVTTDSLVEDVHFRLDWTDWRSLGHKTLAVNLSDLAAMGAAPRLAVLTLGLRGSERVADLQALYAGAGALAARMGVVIAGGDIVASPAALALHVTAIGQTCGGRYLARSGAQPGDVIGVSGTLGAAAAGYRLLRDGGPRRLGATADLLVAAHLRPEPRVQFGQLLLQGGATAAMDLSDGLFGDLPKLLAASGVGARLDEAAIPVAAAVRALFPDELLELATRGGEDYELLFTAPPEAFARIAAAAARIGATGSKIGEVVAAEPARPRLRVVDEEGRERSAEEGAFDHFAGPGRA